MKNNILKSATILGVSIMGMTAALPMAITHAAELGKGGTYTTTAGITFTPSETPTNPLHPTNPDSDKSVTPLGPDGKPDGVNSDGSTKGTQGPLSIDYVSSFDFGTQNISSATEKYFAKAQSYDKDSKPTVLSAQVSDNRGTGAGWTLSVQQGSQFKAGNDELVGAQISLSNLSMATQKGSQVTSPLATKGDINITPGGGAKTIAAAAKGAGQGTWVTRFGDEKQIIAEAKTDTEAKDRMVDQAVYLTVPGSSNKVSKQKYTTDLTWTLTDTPANAK